MFLCSCVGGTLSKKNDLEEYPLRSANQKETAELKDCLRTLQKSQIKKFEKTGSYYTSLKAMKPNSSCNDYKLHMKRTEDGFEIEAKKSDGESSLQWIINQDGVIEEYLEPEEEELEF